MQRAFLRERDLFGFSGALGRAGVLPRPELPLPLPLRSRDRPRSELPWLPDLSRESLRVLLPEREGERPRSEGLSLSRRPFF